MFIEEEKPSDAKTGRPALPPMVWERMREHAQEVAQQIEQRVQYALADGQQREEERQAMGPWGWGNPAEPQAALGQPDRQG
jgi:hypothetical protein